MSKLSNSLNLPLTDELKEFVNESSGNGTLYSTPSEFVRDLIRKEKRNQEAITLRASIIEGYQDAIQERTLNFSGDLKADLQRFKEIKK
ncbi:MAG: hypothetical protein Roseis2KO_08930 [Roseivirga sp.]